MRRCVNCGTVNRDGSSVCGVCGLSLASTTSAIIRSATKTDESIGPERNRWHAYERVLLPSGLGLLAAGVLVLFLEGLLGVILLLAGLAVTGHAIDTAGSRPRRTWRTDEDGRKGRGVDPILPTISRVDADKREMESQARKPEAED